MEEQAELNFYGIPEQEAACILWIWPDSEFEQFKDWWCKMPKYQRTEYLNAYETYGTHGVSFGQWISISRGYHDNRKALAESWARQIREATLAGKPIPIQPAPKFKWVLDWACELAGVRLIASESA